jgi:branched-chain amino acid transport system substrate-binding protein
MELEHHMFRRSSAAAVVLLTSITLTACGSATSESQAKEPLKVAIFPPTSGSLAVTGEAITSGAQLAVDEVNAKGGVDGHKVELVILNTDMTAATTQQLVRRAVQREGASFVTGIVSSPEVVAVIPQLESLNAVLISASSKADDIPAKCNPNTVITTPTNHMSVKAVSNYLAGTPAPKQWSVVAVDTVSGRGAVAAFQEDMKTQGQKMADPIYVPAGTTDFGTVIAKLKAQGSDALFSSVYGSDSGALLKQASQFGLLQSYKTIAGQSFNTELLWDSMGGTEIGTIGNIGQVGQVADDPAVKNEMNSKFASTYQSKYGKLPSYTASDAYLGMQTLFAGVEKTKSIDPKVVAPALHGLSFDSIVGKVSIRQQDGLMVRPEYAGQVVEQNGKPAWKLLKVVPGDEVVAPVQGC